MCQIEHCLYKPLLRTRFFCSCHQRKIFHRVRLVICLHLYAAAVLIWASVKAQRAVASGCSVIEHGASGTANDSALEPLMYVSNCKDTVAKDVMMITPVPNSFSGGLLCLRVASTFGGGGSALLVIGAKVYMWQALYTYCWPGPRSDVATVSPQVVVDAWMGCQVCVFETLHERINEPATAYRYSELQLTVCLHDCA